MCESQTCIRRELSKYRSIVSNSHNSFLQIEHLDDNLFFHHHHIQVDKHMYNCLK